ncbi:sensor histidine kinase [Streptomyces polyrhachis]|uniref:histidine kinase n=1 Tax=Streptomyces polyrhachis TaxID=1282885 RepID=A0ABW2GE54_9ACTN
MWISTTGWLVLALGVAVAAAAALGFALRVARGKYRRALEERGWLLERERQGAAEAAVQAERDRIARELHDIVSHNVSLMVVQASAAREVMAAMPDEASTAIRAVEDAGRSTMTELRHLLGLLAPSPDGAGEEEDSADTVFAPQPGLSSLSRLVDKVSFAGLPVEVRISGEPRPLPTGVEVTAYRIVQEALTNVLKHADGGRAEVTVRYADHSLRVEVLNTGPSALTRDERAPGVPGAPGAAARGRGRPASGHVDGTGRGLLGLRERVAVHGGELDARRRLGGGYRVRARIPLDRP